MSEPIVVELGWPHRDLSQNARVHFAVRARATKEARKEAGWLTKYAMPKGWVHDGKPLALKITVCPPDKRRCDLDGIIGRTKAARDGIADALDVDDWHFHPITAAWGEVVKNGKVVIEVGA